MFGGAASVGDSGDGKDHKWLCSFGAPISFTTNITGYLYILTQLTALNTSIHMTSMTWTLANSPGCVCVVSTIRISTMFDPIPQPSTSKDLHGSTDFDGRSHGRAHNRDVLRFWMPLQHMDRQYFFCCILAAECMPPRPIQLIQSITNNLRKTLDLC